MLASVRNSGEIATDRLFLRRHQRIFSNMAYLETFFSFKWSLLKKQPLILCLNSEVHGYHFMYYLSFIICPTLN